MTRASSETQTRRLPRVVLALPEEMGAKDLSEALHRAGFLPHRAPSPETASLAVTYRSPSVILLHSSFLESSGFRYFESLRVAAPGVPVILLTNPDEEKLRVRVLMQGAEDCLVYPFAHEEALIRVRRVLERRGEVAALNLQKESAESRASQDRNDMSGLRAQMRRSVSLLQRAVDFHQRLDPQGDEETLHAIFLRHLSVQIGVDRLAYLTPSPQSSWLGAAGSWGLPQRLSERIRIPREGELASLLEATGAPMVLDRVKSLPGLRIELGLLSAGGFTACVPLLFKGDLIAIILLGESRAGGPPDEELLRMTQFLASALVPTLTVQTRWSKDRHVSAETLRYLVTALESRNPYLEGHSLRVARLAEGIGVRLGMRGRELSQLTLSALLHDIGRLEVDGALWSKEEPLGSEDWRLIKRHPDEGARILSEASWDPMVVAAVRHHHESWDGTGYPDGLRHQCIPWYARIVAVADAYEALTRSRPQREALSPEEALEVLNREAGTRFDPRVIEAMPRQLESQNPVERAAIG